MCLEAPLSESTSHRPFRAAAQSPQKCQSRPPRKCLLLAHQAIAGPVRTGWITAKGTSSRPPNDPPGRQHRARPQHPTGQRRQSPRAGRAAGALRDCLRSAMQPSDPLPLGAIHPQHIKKATQGAMGVRLHELQPRLSPRFERFRHIRPWPFRRFEPIQPVVYAWAPSYSASLHDTRSPGLHAVLQEPHASCHRTGARRHYSRPFHRTGEVDVTTRPCLGCGRLIASGSRCSQCKRPHHSAERTRRARVVAEWINTYGRWCPGWQRPPHPSADLTADHVTPVATGGSEDGPLRVLYRGCNSARGINP